MKILMRLWSGAKAVENPVLRLLAMAVAGCSVVLLVIPLFMLAAFFRKDPYEDAYWSGYNDGIGR